MSLPYVLFNNIDEFLDELGHFASKDGGTDIDGGVVRITGRSVETGSKFDGGLRAVTVGFRAYDDFFIFEASVDGVTADKIAENVGKKCEELGLKVLGGRFRL